MCEEDSEIVLPPETLESVLVFLSPQDLFSCLSVNLLYRETANNDKIWKQSIRRHLPLLWRIIISQNWRLHLSTDYSSLTRFSQPCFFLQCFMKHAQCLRNQQAGRFTVVTEMLESDGLFKSNGIITACVRSFIGVSIYNLHDLGHIHTIQVEYLVTKLVLSLNELVVGHVNSGVLVYSIQYTEEDITFTLTHTFDSGALVGYSSPTVIFSENSNCSLYSISPPSKTQVKLCEDGYHRGLVCTRENTVLIKTFCSRGYGVVCWDLSTEREKFKIYPDIFRVDDIGWSQDGNFLYSVRNGRVHVYSGEDGKELSSWTHGVPSVLSVKMCVKSVICRTSSEIITFSLTGTELHRKSHTNSVVDIRSHNDLLFVMSLHELQVLSGTGHLVYSVPLPGAGSKSFVDITDYNILIKGNETQTLINYNI